MNLADRLRGIVRPLGSSTAPPAAVAAASPGPRALEEVLGGAWRGDQGMRCFVVERRVEPQVVHGSVRVGDIARSLARGAQEAAMLVAGPPVAEPLVFFDLETTGLSGGAGTHAFLVGCASFDESGALVVRQYLLASYASERPMLQAIAAGMAGAGALVTFNGKSFDAPVLETRYLFHRLEWRGRALPHIDVLHPARRFWGGGVGRGAHHEPGCSLTALEQQVLGAGRQGDIPGFDIPARYFRFVRSGDPAPLAAVLEHNRLDLLSLAALCARLVNLLGGTEEVRTAQEALALGKLFARAGRVVQARHALEQALSMAGSRRETIAIRLESLRALAIAERRARRHAEAERRWRQVLETPGCPPALAREALEALAIHHEHRARDLNTAKAFAVQTMHLAGTKGTAEGARYRLARIERKLAVEQDRRGNALIGL